MNRVFVVITIILSVFASFDLLAQNVVCPNGNTILTSDKSGATYQWEVNSGSTFKNVSNNFNYSGATTPTLNINAIPSAWNGYKYRCIVDGQNSSITSVSISNEWVGAIDSVWEKAGNWQCGSIPELNSNVFIKAASGPIAVNSIVFCKSLVLGVGVRLNILPNGKVTITGDYISSSDFNLSVSDVHVLDTIGVNNPASNQILGPDGNLLSRSSGMQETVSNLTKQLLGKALKTAQNLAQLKTDKIYDTNEGGEGPRQFGLAYSFGSNIVTERKKPLFGDELHKTDAVFGTDCSGFIQKLFESAGIEFNYRLTTSFDAISKMGFQEKLQNAIDGNATYKKIAVINYGELEESKIRSGDIILWKADGHVGIISDILSPPSIARIIWQSNGQPDPLTKRRKLSSNPDLFRSSADEQADNLSMNRGVRPIDFIKATTIWKKKYEILRLETFTDNRDNQEYKIRQIGSQIVLAENFKYDYLGSYCYQNSVALCDVYGRLYDFNQAKASVPAGWHLPTDAEWETFSTFLGGASIAGGAMKEIGTGIWQSPNFGATNKSGFSALPGGNRNTFGSNFANLGLRGFWWSSTINPNNTTQALNRVVDYETTTLGKGSANRQDGRTHFSVRLFKNP